MARLATLTILAVGAAACLWLNWPGHFSWDSVKQLAEGRTGAYSGQHPPVMSWLLGVADRASRGASPFVVFDVALVFGALAAFVLIPPRAGWPAAVVAAPMIAIPQLLFYPAVVWKDVLFAGASTAGFACLACTAALWPARRSRTALISVSLLFVALAALTRQNGAIVLLMAALALGGMAVRAGEGTPRGLIYGAGFLAGGAAIVLTASAALATHVIDPRAASRPWEHLQAYDLVAAAARDPRLDLVVLHRRAPQAEALVRGPGVQAYSPSRIDTLIDPVLTPLDAEPDASNAVADEWRALISRHPALYLRVRASAFRWVLTTPEPSECVLEAVGVDGDVGDLAAAGLTARHTEADDRIANYVEALGGWPVMQHAFYSAVALGLLIFLLVRRRAADIPVCAMLASGLLFAASFALISIACDYRYLYDLDLATIAAGLYVAASWRVQPREVVDLPARAD